MKYRYLLILALLTSLSLIAWHSTKKPLASNSILLRNATVIDGNGGAPMEYTDVLIQGDTIAAIGRNLPAAGAAIENLTGKTIMPALISAHVHVGLLKDTLTRPENYTRANILRQLKRYQDYGIENVLVMGTDRPMLFNSRLRDSSETGKLPGARLHSAGYGFAAPDGAPAMDLLYRPATSAEVPAAVAELVKLHPTVIKMWVDDFGKKSKKMDPEVSKAIIAEAHKQGIRVASHVYYLEDAKRLVADGLDIIAHSIRDKDIDEDLLKMMKARNVTYIPTLSLDEYAYIYARFPSWIDDAFFKASLEPGVFAMISSPAYQNRIKTSPDYAKNMAAFETALRNLKRIYAAGILVALGSDSGAQPIRTQGFSEHLELELMVQAGLTPLQVITVATKNAARTLRINKWFGTIEKGKTADLVILNSNPSVNIKNTRSIVAVFKSGQEVSKGPL